MPKSRKINKGLRTTAKKRAITNAQKTTIIKVFIEMLTTIKLYHWKTKSYSKHQVTDELHEKISKNSDRFVEVLLGKDASRVIMVEKTMKMMDSRSSAEFLQKMHSYREMLIRMDSIFHKKRDTDLLNIRDEMLADLNQFLYLMSFDK
jgi:hypothetical protein